MQYLMFVCVDPNHSEADAAAAPEIEEWVERHDRSGARVLGDRLRPLADAKTVRVRNGELLVTDGPFAESKEWIAGFDVIEAASIDEAIVVASGHPMAYAGRIELRPFWSGDDD